MPGRDASRSAGVSRRSVLAGTAGTAAVAALAALPLPRATAETSPDPGPVPLPLLAPLPPGAPARRLFTPLEQRFAGYLAILPGMTNDIVDDDAANYGFMGGGWWRQPNAPYNARVQEHVYTLSWFLANERSWNPYRADPALQARLDAAIGHYLALQHPDGSWPEYNINERSKAATGFGMGYLAKTLANLRQARALPARQAAIETALRAGMGWFLNPATPIWGDTVQYANQNAAGLAGSTKSLTLNPDRSLQAMLDERIEYLAAHGQSPAGFFYEPTGMDIDYNFEVLMPEIAEIYLLTGNRTVLSMARKFTEWFGYNLLREPDGSGWLTYIAMSARTSVAYYDDVVPDPDRTNLASWFVPEIPDLGAFFTSREDRAATRAAWAAEPGPAPGLAKQNTSPRIIAHAPYGEALPSNAEKARAIRRVPYLLHREFAEIRRDAEHDEDYLYVRRPALYFGGFFGSRPTSRVRSGPGFLWHPDAGTIVHAQQSDTGAWSTLLPNTHADGHSDLVASYDIGGHSWDGHFESPGSAPVHVRYQLPDGRIVTDLTITRDAVTRAVRATSATTEQIPLVLQPGDDVVFADGTPAGYGQNTSAVATGLVLRRGGVTIRIEWSDRLAATLTATDTTYLRDARRRLHVLRVPHPGPLTTRIAVG